jgi:CarboxypepD_reg-like domain
MKYLLILLFSFCGSMLTAQQQLHFIKGKLTDEGTKKALPFVSIGFAGNSHIGTISEEDGSYSIPLYNNSLLEDSVLQFSLLGYESKRITIHKDAIPEKLDVALKLKSNNLPVIEVKDRSGSAILKMTIAHLPKVLAPNAYSQPMFYRQMHKENGTWVRLIEAYLDVLRPKWELQKNKTLQEKFNLLALRRSNVYERNAYVHGDHLFDLMVDNIINYPLGSPLLAGNMDFFRISDLTTDSNEYLIYYQTLSTSNPSWTKGYIRINKADTAITDILTDRFTPKDQRGEFWWFKKGQTHTHLSKHADGFYYTDTLSMYYEHLVMNMKSKNYEYLVEEHFDLYDIHAPIIKVNNPDEISGYSNFIGLYGHHYQLSDFEKCDSLYQYQPLYPKDLQPDLEQQVPLYLQFKINE